jgi:hypothetical protein
VAFAQAPQAPAQAPAPVPAPAAPPAVSNEQDDPNPPWGAPYSSFSNKVHQYNQAKLDFFRRVMRQIQLVGNALQEGGIANLNRQLPWYRLDPRTVRTLRPGVIAAVRNGAVIPFPSLWGQLEPLIDHFLTKYKYMWGGVPLADQVSLNWDTGGGDIWVLGPWLDGSSSNWPVLGGLSFSGAHFYRSPVNLVVGELIHEGAHDMAQYGIASLGSLSTAHWNLRNLVPMTGYNADAAFGDDAYSQFVRFAMNARLLDGRTLWQAILDEAGPAPVRPW